MKSGDLHGNIAMQAIENVDFRAFGRYVFGNLGNEVNVIIYCYLVPCRLSSDNKMYDLE